MVKKRTVRKGRSIEAMDVIIAGNGETDGGNELLVLLLPTLLGFGRACVL